MEARRLAHFWASSARREFQTRSWRLAPGAACGLEECELGFGDGSRGLTGSMGSDCVVGVFLANRDLSIKRFMEDYECIWMG